jgi:hypothetical protein
MEMQCLTHMGTHKGYITFKRKSLLGGFKGTKCDSETRIAKTKWWTMSKFVQLSREANPLLDEVES